MVLERKSVMKTELYSAFLLINGVYCESNNVSKGLDSLFCKTRENQAFFLISLILADLPLLERK